jgi:transposase-like protein
VPQEQPDLENARTFFVQQSGEIGSPPTAVITDGHQAYRRAIRKLAPKAVHTATGLHGAAGHPTMQLVERSHIAVKHGLRPMRGLQEGRRRTRE